MPAVTLLQLHNGLTTRRDDEPFSITPDDVLGAGGVLEAFHELRRAGTGSVHRAYRDRPAGCDARGRSLRRLRHDSGAVSPAQPERRPAVPLEGLADTDYGNIIADCAEMNMGVFAIRVFAGGALLGHEPSAHTLEDAVLPAALNTCSDRERADRLAPARVIERKGACDSCWTIARVHSAIIGFASAEQVEEVAGLMDPS